MAVIGSEFELVIAPDYRRASNQIVLSLQIVGRVADRECRISSAGGDKEDQQTVTRRVRRRENCVIGRRRRAAKRVGEEETLSLVSAVVETNIGGYSRRSD